MKGISSGVFGTQAEREDLLQRDISRSPFKNPTLMENPSPDRYNMHTKVNNTTFTGGTKFGSQQSYEGSESIRDLNKFNADYKPDSQFISVQPRDNLASVSKDSVMSPGPGSYIPLDILSKTG